MRFRTAFLTGFLTVLAVILAVPAAADTFTLSLESDGNTIDYVVRGTYSLVALYLDGGGAYVTSSPAIGKFTCLSQGLHTVSAISFTGSGNSYSMGTVSIITTAPSPCGAPGNTIEFNVTNQSSDAERRVLLSNLEPGYPYPHFQGIGAQDGRVPMFVRTVDTAGQPKPGLTVYLRVIDPPDTAPYTQPPYSTLSQNGDNHGPLATIEGSAITPNSQYSLVWQGTSGANGELDFTLALSIFAAAGDNYQVEAAFDPAFPGGGVKSGTLTAWKRVFIEKLSALRNGIPLDRDAFAGDGTIHIADNHFNGNQNNGRISKGDRIIFVHAPAIDRRNALAGWYKEEHNVADVTRDPNGGFMVTLGTRNGKTITPEPLLHDFGEDPSARRQPAFSDWIARLSGSTLGTADYFDADTHLIWGNGSPFTDAFVEYYMLPGSPFGFVPLPHFGDIKQDILQTFGDKWSFTSAGTAKAPNHQLLIIADNDMTQAQDAGVTILGLLGETSSWVWRGTIESSVKNNTTGLTDAEAWTTKTCAHEIAHEWQTDGTFNLLDHCPVDTPTYNDPALVCLLAAPDAAAQAQRTNGIARFHLLKIQPVVGPPYYHSEYFGIRTRPDPFVP